MILAVIILLNILDFFELLDPFWDYIKKIVSWVLIGYLLYHVSVSDILFGVKRRLFDFSFVLGGFAMNLNDIIQYAAIARADMIVHATDHLAFVKRQGLQVAQVMVTNVSEAAWNTMTMIGVVPEAPARIIEHAPNITVSSPTVTFLFERGAEQAGYVLLPLGPTGALLQWYNTLVPHIAAIQRWGIVVGVIALLCLAIYAALRIRVTRPSTIALIDKEGGVHGISHLLYRGTAVFLALMFFFLFVFNLIMEWLAIAIDAPILMVGLSASVILFFTSGFKTDWIEAVGNFGVDFYERFIRLFHDRQHILLGISGLLVLHVLTEVGNFLLPFVAPMRDPLYLSQIGPGHENLFVLAAQGFTGSLFSDSVLVLVAGMNVVAWVFLLIIPGYIWYKIVRLRHESHERHYPNFAPWMLGLFYGSVATMLLVPMITIRRLDSTGLVGVDFITRAASEAAVVAPVIALLIGVGLFAVTYFLSLFLKKFLMLGPLFGSVVLLGIYSYLFFVSSVGYYLNAGLLAIASGWPVLGGAMFLFLLFTILFYVSGYLIFLYEIVRD